MQSSLSNKCGVAMKSFSKWIAKNNRTPNTTRWFNYDIADREYVATLSFVQFVSIVMISCCVLHMYSTAWLGVGHA